MIRILILTTFFALGLGAIAQAQWSPPAMLSAMPTAAGGGAPAGPFVFKCQAHGNTHDVGMATNGGNGTGSNVDCTGANTFFCIVGRYTGSGSLSQPTDTSSNTYTQVGVEQATGSSTAISLWRSFAGSTSAAFHWGEANPGNANFSSMACAGFSDGSTSAEDTTYTHAFANSPGAITPTGTNRLMVAGFVTADPDSGVPSISAGGYTISGPQAQGGGIEGSALAYKIQTTAVSDNPTFATSGGATGASLQQAFR